MHLYFFFKKDIYFISNHIVIGNYDRVLNEITDH